MSSVKASGISVKNPKSLFIGGKWVQPSTSNTLSVVSPVTEEVIAVYAEANEQDVDRAVAAAREAFDNGPWPRTSPQESTHRYHRSRFTNFIGTEFLHA